MLATSNQLPDQPFAYRFLSYQIDKQKPISRRLVGKLVGRSEHLVPLEKPRQFEGYRYGMTAQ